MSYVGSIHFFSAGVRPRAVLVAFVEAVRFLVAMLLQQKTTEEKRKIKCVVSSMTFWSVCVLLSFIFIFKSGSW